MKDIRMVVTDLDSTLLRRDKTVSAFTLDTIAELRRRGIVFAIATARPYRSVKIPFPWLKFDAAAYHNGALVHVDGRPVASIGIADAPSVIAPILREIPGAHICCEINDLLYTNFNTLHLWPTEPFILTEGFDEIAGRTADKLIIECHSLEEMAQYERFLPGELYAQLSEHVIAMVMNRSATKVNAIKLLAEHYNIPMESIAAFGDDYNDVGMLRACGIGVAVANALPDVRAAADQIALSNEEDGEARWIAENLL